MPITGELREAIFARDGRQCRYCGSTQGPFWIDHVYPESKGGETTLENLVVACRACNANKGRKVGVWPKTERSVKMEYPSWCIYLVSIGTIIILMSFLIGLVFEHFYIELLIIGSGMSASGMACEKIIDTVRSQVGGEWVDHDEN